MREFKRPTGETVVAGHDILPDAARQNRTSAGIDETLRTEFDTPAFVFDFKPRSHFVFDANVTDK